MSNLIERPSEAPPVLASDGLFSLPQNNNFTRLDALPVGAHLIVKCRKDWRDATVINISLDLVVLSVGSPSGRTYRLRRPSNTPLFYDGLIPIIGEGLWRTGFVAYDKRW